MFMSSEKFMAKEERQIHDQRMRRQHFVIIAYAAQGHINPARHLARRLAELNADDDARITIAVPVSAYRKMFPAVTSTEEEVKEAGNGISYVAYSDGYDEGFDRSKVDLQKYWSESKRFSSRSFSSALDRFASVGCPATCIISTMLVSWHIEVANCRGIPFVQYWIQPVTVLAAYYHYYHGYSAEIAAHSGDPCYEVNLPELPPLKIRELPSFLTITSRDDPYAIFIEAFAEHFDVIDRNNSREDKKMTILVNSFEELEADALKSIEALDVLLIGPVLTYGGGDDSKESSDLFKSDQEQRYMDWLDSKLERSVVYVSFGSLSMMNRRQIEEMRKGLRESGANYLWVVRVDNRSKEGMDHEKELLGEDDDNGIVIEWCDQLKVLSHPAVGCFVTHCGWNSTLEAIACGVPAIAVPQWTDQCTNARLMEIWGVGIRATVADGVLDAEELKRCLGLVLGDGKTAAEMRSKSETLKLRAAEAVGAGGSSAKNLAEFVEKFRRVK